MRRVKSKLNVVFVFFLLQLFFHGCFSFNPKGLALWKFRSRVKIDRDDSPCNWKGINCLFDRIHILLELQEKSSHGEKQKHAILQTDTIISQPDHDVVHVQRHLLQKQKHAILQTDTIISQHVHDVVHVRRHLLQKDKHVNLQTDTIISQPLHDVVHVRRHLLQKDKDVNLHTDTIISQPIHDVVHVRRHLLQKTRNVQGAHSTSAPPISISVEAREKDSSSPVRSSRGNGNRVVSSTKNPSSTTVQIGESGKHDDDHSASKSWEKWIYTVVVPTTAFILVVGLILFFVFRRNAAMISPCKTGHSAQPEKTFITGVPKLNQAELEDACEDFTNVVTYYPNCTVFKGTLPSGVEIAAASMNASNWSDHFEINFRNKIDAVSRINHKNYVNLLGYCHEEDPFMRMMVFEYAPNGTLFEHLHAPDFERLEWRCRMRIIMGIAYCLEYMHNMNPPAVHPILQSTSVFITDDNAAKVTDIGMFNDYNEDGIDNTVQFTSSESNVYSFGILLLEIVSGRMPISEEDGVPILIWAADYLEDKKKMNSLLDPSLKSIKEDELEIIYNIIKICTLKDPKIRPTMKEITALLKEVLAISPQQAAPMLSPLLWAELEILQIE